MDAMQIIKVLLDTENDIVQRKTLVLVAHDSQNNIFESKRATLKMKIRIFRNLKERPSFCTTENCGL